MRIRQETIAEIQQIPIDLVARDLGIIIRNKMAICYNGHDTVASLSIHLQKNIYKCFGCGEKGGVINLIMNALKLDFVSACNLLVEKYLLPSGNVIYKTAIVNRNPILQKKAEISPNPVIYEWIISNTVLSERAFNYLHVNRKIKRDVLEQMDVRSIDNPVGFNTKLVKEFGVEDLLACGIAKKTAKGIGFHWWSPGIIFPCKDLNFRITYIQTRPYNSSNHKYLNLNGIAPHLYNLDVLHHLKQDDLLLFCEGITDTLSAVCMGYSAIGILGAHSFDPADVKKFKDYQVAVVPDSDTGGNHLINNLKTAFAKFGKNIDTYKVPEGYNDLNEFFIKENSRF